VAHPTTSNHPLLKNSTSQWAPTEWDTPGSDFWSTFEMVKWMTYIQARCDALEDTSLGLLTDTASSTGGVFARLAALEAGAGSARFLNFSTMPGFTDGTLTYPLAVTANHEDDLSIVSGKLRITGGSAKTDNSLRRVYGLTSAGVMGDSEVKSTFSGTNVDWNTNDDRVQPGHCHRMTRQRKTLVEQTAASAVGSNTISAAGTPWASAQFNGTGQLGREVWVHITAGPGEGQKRRVISNTTSQLTVFPAWSTTSPDVIPTTSSKFEVYTHIVRAVTVKWGVIAGHGFLQPNVWDNLVYRQPDTGQVDLHNYSRPLGGFGSYRPYPWHLKTRVVGNTLDAAMWVDTDLECAYGTAGQSASWTLGSGNDYGYADEPGYSGLYMAHLNAGDYGEWDDLTVTKL
jgi:hypothetical protein